MCGVSPDNGLMEFMDEDSDNPNWNKEIQSSTQQVKHTLRNQAGGHAKLIQIGNGYVGKPLIPREAEMYRLRPQKIAPFLPEFKGILSSSSRDRYIRKEDNNSNTEHIILEDLTRHFEAPCILDLKMGTRMYKDSASKAKKESQERKCRNSTSQKLGVRLCGSHWFNPRTGQSCKTDKYTGRALNVIEFETAFLTFLSDGYKLRKSLILDILRQIEEMRRVIQSLNTFRFYSSSLLIVYDGKVPESSATRHHHKNSQDSHSLDSSDFLLEQEDSLEERPDFFNRTKVRVKIIDFANCTFEGFLDDPIVHDGPDRGFLKGLDSIINILKTSLISE